MKKNLFERLRDWDEGDFDLTDALPEQRIPEQPAGDAGLKWDPNTPIARLETRQIEGFKRFYPWLAGLLCVVMIGFLMISVLDLPPYGAPDNPPHNEVMERYVSEGMYETGAVNTVAGVILDYRAFDTLGEAHVLYAAACAVMILLSGFRSEKEPENLRRILEEDPVLRRTARVLVPVILLFGSYVILTGHLGPGGGFSGGAILGSGMMLCAMSFGFAAAERIINIRIYRIVISASLGFYSVAKCYSFFCGANHLQSIFTPGTPGRILSAGLIMPLNVAVGLVVGCTMYGFYSIFRRGRI
jgi:multicomponent Na+:H+ antiporter subunit B